MIMLILSQMLFVQYIANRNCKYRLPFIGKKTIESYECHIFLCSCVLVVWW